MTAEGTDPAPPEAPGPDQAVPAGRPSDRSNIDWDSWEHPFDDPDLVHRRLPGLTGPAPQDTRLSGFAVLAFVFGLLGGLLGLVFGIIALRDIGRTGRRGKGLAIAGLSLLGVWMIVAAVGLVVFLQTADRVNAIHDLRSGDCLNLDEPGPGTPFISDSFTVIECTQPHNAEFVGQAPGHYDDPTEKHPPEFLGAYPGADTLTRRAETWCPTLGRDYVLDPLSLPAGTHLRWFLPRESEWTRSRGSIACFLAGGNGAFDRPLKMNAATVDAEQLRFLLAIREAREEIERVSALGRTAPMTELGDAATRVVMEQSERRQRLRLGPWPAPVQPAMDRLVLEAEAAEPLWRDLGNAASPDALFERLTRAEQHTNPETELAVRRALGLPTVQGEPVG
ncbi:DUF4190 domain-containing protein [Micromonospora sp. NPDC004704]